MAVTRKQAEGYWNKYNKDGNDELTKEEVKACLQEVYESVDDQDINVSIRISVNWILLCHLPETFHGQTSKVQVTRERFALIPWSCWRSSLGVGIQCKTFAIIALLNAALARRYKTFFMLNSAEHEIFPANEYENASRSLAMFSKR